MADRLILIDGDCMLCQRVTRFVVRYDHAKKFKFAALQSPIGQRMLERHQLPMHQFNTFVFIEKGRYYTRSTAALRVFRALGGWWSLLYAGIIIPTFIRDGIYRFIAGNRYRWFGKTDQCLLPTPELRSRFMEGEEKENYENRK